MSNEPAVRYAPKNASQLDQMALIGGLIGIFQAAETMVNECVEYPALYKFTGKMALNRLNTEIERLNRWLEFGWDSEGAEGAIFLANDAKDMMKVLATMEPATRTNMVDSFRRVWATMQEEIGLEGAKEKMEEKIAFIREQRGLGPAEPVMLEEDAVKILNEGPNCVIFVRDKHSKQFIEGVTVHVEMEDGQRDLIKSTDPDTLYERRYPTGIRIAFKGFKAGYVPSGVEKYFYAEDPEQLVVTIWMEPAAA